MTYKYVLPLWTNTYVQYQRVIKPSYSLFNLLLALIRKNFFILQVTVMDEMNHLIKPWYSQLEKCRFRIDFIRIAPK